jgi:hypothetical protein
MNAIRPHVVRQRVLVVARIDLQGQTQLPKCSAQNGVTLALGTRQRRKDIAARIAMTPATMSIRSR